MEALPWFWIWVAIAAILFIFEMLSLSFFLLPFAIGAVIAAIFNAIGLDLVWQVIIFIVASVLTLIALRPAAKRLTKKGSNVKVGAERLVGMQGKIVEGGTSSGQVRVLINGELWNASTEDSAKLEVDTAVEVLAINSNELIIKALKQSSDEPA